MSKIKYLLGFLLLTSCASGRYYVDDCFMWHNQPEHRYKIVNVGFRDYTVRMVGFQHKDYNVKKEYVDKKTHKVFCRSRLRVNTPFIGR